MSMVEDKSFAGGIVIDRQAGVASPDVVRNGQRRLNTALAAVLLAIVALAPVPLGSNRPFFWAMWAAGLGLVAVAYFVLLALRRESLRVPLRRLWMPLLLAVGLCGFLVVQMLPLGGTIFATASGDMVTSPTLSLSPGATWLMLLQLLTYGLFYFLMLQVAVNRARARTMGQVILLIIAAHALYGLLALTVLGDTLLFFDKWAYAGFATGTFVNRNSFATFLAFGLVLGVLASLRELFDAAERGKGGLQSGLAPVYLACTALILATLVATGSRMGLLAGLAGAGCAAILALRKRHKTRGGLGWLVIGAVPMLAAVAVLVLYGAGTFDRLGSLEGDANVRGDLYAQVLEMIALRPWLGYGGGAFELAYPLFHQLPVSADLSWDKAHSTYLGLWAELGIVAGSAPLILIAWIGIGALDLSLKRRGDWMAPAAAFCVVLVAAIHSLVDFSLEMEANVFLFLALLALGVARGAGKPDEPADGRGAA
jgi:O-antigen ligase